MHIAVARILSSMMLRSYLEQLLTNCNDPDIAAFCCNILFSGRQTLTKYEYDPYGNTLSKSGALADVNPFRFSTKYLDVESDLYYYALRFYSANLARWLSRDPIEEQGGLPLYCFVENEPMGRIDMLGDDWNWIQCLRASRIDVFLRDGEKPGEVAADLIVVLDKRKCRCICEFPKWKQWVRESRHRTNPWAGPGGAKLKGLYRDTGSWEKDGWGEWYRHQSTRIFDGDLQDKPGVMWSTPYWLITEGFMLEFKDKAYCTQGRQAGSLIGKVEWTIEVKRASRRSPILSQWWGGGTPPSKYPCTNGLDN